MSDSGRPKRVILIGIDAGTWDIIKPMIERGELPHIALVMKAGISADLISTIPSHTPTAFASLMTGVNPGKHGIYHFCGKLHSNYLDSPLLNHSDIPLKTIFNIFTEQGRKVVLLAVPMTSPPPHVNGAVVSLQTPGVMKPRHIVTHPPELKEELMEKFGEINEGMLSHPDSDFKTLPLNNFLDHTIKKMHFLVEKLRVATIFFLKEKPWDFFMVHFMITDALQHIFWEFMDPSHIAHDPSLASRYQNVIFDAYRKIDNIIGEVLEIVGENTTIIIMSDHGSSPIHRKFNKNKWLQEKGLLHMNSSSHKLWSYKVTYPTVYKGLTKLQLSSIEKVLPDWIRRLRIPILKKHPKPIYELIDWQETKAYGVPGGGININVKGREPKGVVEQVTEYDQLIHYLQDELYALKDPKTGKQVVDKVVRKEEIFNGPLVNDAPDLFIFFKEDFFCFPIDGLFEKDIFTECRHVNELFKKEEMSSSHHTAMLGALKGILIMKGPDIRLQPVRGEAHIVDLPPTILYLLGLPVPEHFDGKILADLIEPDVLKKNPPVMTKMENDGFLPDRQRYTFSREEEEIARQQLRNLGYLE